MIYQTIKSAVEEIENELIENRRFLHKNPELSFNEHNTMKFICGKLDEMGVSYKSEVAGTGVVAEIYGRKASDTSKCVLVRADMDALPIDEAAKTSYSSQNTGVMHACGHDAHTAILLALCKVLSKLDEKFSGCVKLVFQPGEETSGGAEPMIESGILKNPDVDICLALHMDPDIECGKIRVKEGSLYASPDDFKITVIGKGGHGAEPHNCINPIYAAAKIISLLQNAADTVNSNGKAVVSVCMINSGTASNIVPDKAEIVGTARSLKNDVRAFLKNKIGEIAKSVCDEFGAECIYEYTELFPPLINDASVAKELYNCACGILGENNCIWGGEPTMAGEDFAYFSQKVPSVLFKLGCRNESRGIVYPLHHSSFDIDEACLKHGAEVFAAYIINHNNR